MNSYTVRIDTDAITDIKGAAYWYNKQLSGLGDRFKRQVKTQIDSLERNADIYSIRYGEVHCMIVKRFPFLIHFTIDKKSSTVKVFAVIHTSRNPRVWEERTKEF